MNIDYEKYHGMAVSKMRKELKYYTDEEVKTQVDADHDVLWRMVAGAVRNTYRVEFIPVKKKAYGSNLAF